MNGNTLAEGNIWLPSGGVRANKVVASETAALVEVINARVDAEGFGRKGEFQVCNG